MSSASQTTFIIVGAGHAGGRAALTLREEGFDGRLIMVGDELHLPYERPPLSKGLLQGTAHLAAFSLCDAARLDQLAIEHLPGNPAAQLDTERQQLHLTDGRVLPYDGLLLATGGRARRLPDVPAHWRNVLYLRTHDEALLLREQLQPGARLVVVGGGFIGLEVAATARALGCQVTLLEAGERLAARVLPERLSHALLTLHGEQGVDVRLGVNISAVQGRERAEAVQLADGTQLPCDLLVIGIGMQPMSNWPAQPGLMSAKASRSMRSCVPVPSTSMPLGMSASFACARTARSSVRKPGETPRPKAAMPRSICWVGNCRSLMCRRSGRISLSGACRPSAAKPTARPVRRGNCPAGRFCCFTSMPRSACRVSVAGGRARA